jgi:sialidase-1
VDNPTLVVAGDDSVHLLFQTGFRRLWHRVSRDGGSSFGRARELTAVVRSASYEGFAIRRFGPGPGVGAVLSTGRLVIPIWVSSGTRNRPSATMTLVSDDCGLTWTSGDIVAGPGGRYPNPSEAAVAAADGGAVMTFRQRTVPHRIVSWSPDGATGWATPTPSVHLFEPACHAALAAVAAEGRHLLAFANPDSRKSSTPMQADGKAPRENLTLRWSSDGGRHWSTGIVLDAGPAGYAVLASTARGRLNLVWEQGRKPGTPTWPAAIHYRDITALVPPATAAEQTDPALG